MKPNNEFIVVDDDWGFGPCMVLKVPWNDKFADIMKAQNITGLRLSRSAGWKGTDVAFVADLDFLVGIAVYNWDVKDVSPVFRNTGLRYVNLECQFTSKAQFENLKNLESCFVTWRPKISGLESCTKLNRLNVVSYPHETLERLSSLTMIKTLDISSRKLRTLHGVESMSRLQSFDAAHCTELHDISQLMLCKKLEVISFEVCKKIAALPELMNLDLLKEIKLADCGKLESLHPLSGCISLNKLRFHGDTIVTDGNIDFLLKLPCIEDVWFANRKHYSMTRESLAEQLCAARVARS